MYRSHFSVPLAVIVAGITGASSAHATVRVGYAMMIERNVSGTLSGQQRKVLKGDDVFENDFIRTETESSAGLLFVDKTQLILGPTAIAKLDRLVFNPDQSVGALTVSARQGAVRWISGESASRAYQIKTSTVTIRPHGTMFDALVEPRRTTIVLQEGIIEVCLISAPQRCRVLSRPGEQLTTTLNAIEAPQPGGPGSHQRADRTLTHRFSTLIPMTHPLPVAVVDPTPVVNPVPPGVIAPPVIPAGTPQGPYTLSGTSKPVTVPPQPGGPTGPTVPPKLPNPPEGNGGYGGSTGNPPDGGSKGNYTDIRGNPPDGGSKGNYTDIRTNPNASTPGEFNENPNPGGTPGNNNRSQMGDRRPHLVDRTKVLRAPVTAAALAARANVPSSNAVKLSTPRVTNLHVSTPKVNVPTPKVNVPTPRVNVSTPKVNVPTPRVNVTVKTPTIRVPTVRAPTIR